MSIPNPRISPRMRLQLLAILLISHFQLVADDRQFEVGDTLFVWADNGIIVRSEPSMDAKAIIKLSYGEKVTVLEVIDRELESEIIQSVTVKNQVFPRITVIGKFVKVNLSGSIGYVYGGLLSRLKPMQKGERFEAYLSRVFGILTVVADVRQDNSDYRFKRIIYANGAMLQQEHGNENWWNHLYLIPDITLNEAYLLINRLVCFETEYKRAINEGSDWIETHPTKFEPNAIVLQSGPFEETCIKLESHYIFITMSGGN
jgi:hypothetical protein